MKKKFISKIEDKSLNILGNRIVDRHIVLNSNTKSNLVKVQVKTGRFRRLDKKKLCGNTSPGMSQLGFSKCLKEAVYSSKRLLRLKKSLSRKKNRCLNSKTSYGSSTTVRRIHEQWHTRAIKRYAKNLSPYLMGGLLPYFKHGALGLKNSRKRGKLISSKKKVQLWGGIANWYRPLAARRPEGTHNWRIAKGFRSSTGDIHMRFHKLNLRQTAKHTAGMNSAVLWYKTFGSTEKNRIKLLSLRKQLKDLTRKSNLSLTWLHPIFPKTYHVSQVRLASILAYKRLTSHMSNRHSHRFMHLHLFEDANKTLFKKLSRAIKNILPRRVVPLSSMVANVRFKRRSRVKRARIRGNDWYSNCYRTQIKRQFFKESVNSVDNYTVRQLISKVLLLFAFKKISFDSLLGIWRFLKNPLSGYTLEPINDCSTTNLSLMKASYEANRLHKVVTKLAKRMYLSGGRRPEKLFLKNYATALPQTLKASGKEHFRANDWRPRLDRRPSISTKLPVKHLRNKRYTDVIAGIINRIKTVTNLHDISQVELKSTFLLKQKNAYRTAQLTRLLSLVGSRQIYRSPRSFIRINSMFNHRSSVALKPLKVFTERWANSWELFSSDFGDDLEDIPNGVFNFQKVFTSKIYSRYSRQFMFSFSKDKLTIQNFKQQGVVARLLSLAFNHFQYRAGIGSLRPTKSRTCLQSLNTYRHSPLEIARIRRKKKLIRRRGKIGKTKFFKSCKFTGGQFKLNYPSYGVNNNTFFSSGYSWFTVRNLATVHSYYKKFQAIGTLARLAGKRFSRYLVNPIVRSNNFKKRFTTGIKKLQANSHIFHARLGLLRARHYDLNLLRSISGCLNVVNSRDLLKRRRKLKPKLKLKRGSRIKFGRFNKPTTTRGNSIFTTYTSLNTEEEKLRRENRTWVGKMRPFFRMQHHLLRPNKKLFLGGLYYRSAKGTRRFTEYSNKLLKKRLLFPWRYLYSNVFKLRSNTGTPSMGIRSSLLGSKFGNRVVYWANSFFSRLETYHLLNTKINFLEQAVSAMPTIPNSSRHGSVPFKWFLRRYTVNVKRSHTTRMFSAIKLWKRFYLIKRTYKLKHYFRTVRRVHGSRINKYNNLFMFRLDSMILQLGLIRDIAAIQHLITTGYVAVNGLRCLEPSYLLKRYDSITFLGAARWWLRIFFRYYHMTLFTNPDHIRSKYGFLRYLHTLKNYYMMDMRNAHLVIIDYPLEKYINSIRRKSLQPSYTHIRWFTCMLTRR